MKRFSPIIAMAAIIASPVAVAHDDHTAAPAQAAAAPAAQKMPEGHMPVGTMPKGHPSAETAADTAANLPNEGKVVDFKDAGGYTYFEVTYKDGTRWLAAPKTFIDRGAVIRYGNGSTMVDFKSKTLNRTFPEIIFLDRVVIMSRGGK